MADLLAKAREMIGSNTLPFKMNADGKTSTNCVQFIISAAGLDNSEIQYPKVDFLISKYKKANQFPNVGDVIAYPSEEIGRGSWQQFVPGCCAIISEILNSKPSKIIIAHPTIPGVIGEISAALFDGKPVSFLEIN